MGKIAHLSVALKAVVRYCLNEALYPSYSTIGSKDRQIDVFASPLSLTVPQERCYDASVTKLKWVRLKADAEG